MKEKLKQNMHRVFLLDRSGSMKSAELDTIGGYNSYLEKNKNNQNKTYITTVLFDDNIEILHNKKEINKVKELTTEEYFARGTTALLDAIGITITKIKKKADEKILFVITTDGLENASKEFTKENIKKLIDERKDWEFIFLGSTIDSYKEASTLGIKEENTSNYQKDKKGVMKMFNAVDKLSRCIMEENPIDNWKEDLE